MIFLRRHDGFFNDPFKLVPYKSRYRYKVQIRYTTGGYAELIESRASESTMPDGCGAILITILHRPSVTCIVIYLGELAYIASATWEYRYHCCNTSSSWANVSTQHSVDSASLTSASTCDSNTFNSSSSRSLCLVNVWSRRASSPVAPAAGR